MMEKTPRRSDLPLLLTLLVVFLLLAVEFGGAEDPNGALTHVRIQASCRLGCRRRGLGGRFNALMSGTPQVNLEPCISGGEVKRLDDVDHDSFVGLMGRRNAAEPNCELPPQQPPPHTRP